MPPLSSYGDLERPPLRPEALNRGLVRDGNLWREVRVVEQTRSTNADLVAAARTGAPQGLVLVAEWQTAGRGRLDRAWTAPPRAGLTFSLLLRPVAVPAAALPWLPLLVGVSVARATARLAEVVLGVKWPNDVLAGDQKLCGVLAERVETPAGVAVVVGVGLNVTTRADELPTPAATSLALRGATTTDRDPLLRACLREVAGWYAAWQAAGGDATACGLRTEYVRACTTLGRSVRVQLPNGDAVAGSARDIDSAGHLVVVTDQGDVVLGAGDVVHVR
jgi:BirA family biotin operon repressor/biotin-[acetyl-CoA-carboxylase] ligase